MAVHFWGPLHLVRAALPHLRRAGDGRVVNVASSAPLLSIAAATAARRIVAACRRGDPFLACNWSAVLALRAEGLAPATTQRLLAIAGALLPAGGAHEERGAPTPAWRRPTRWVPPLLTRLGDRAALENGELVGEAASWPAP